jgi:hypothetical protein
MNGKPDEALQSLRTVADMGLIFPVKDVEAFGSIKDRDDFR